MIAPKPPTSPTSQPDGPWLERIEELYKKSDLLGAWELAAAVGPLQNWTGVRGSILAGRLAANLGSMRLAGFLHRQGHRRYPEDLELAVSHGYGRFQSRGPLVAWELLKGLPTAACQPSAQALAELHCLAASVIGKFRDFEAAEARLERARELAPEDPWVDVVAAGLREKQDRYEEALALARRSLEACPLYRPALMTVAHLLQVLGRRDEALDVLEKARQKTRCGPIVAQLAALHKELDHHREALALFDQYLELSPLADKTARTWVDRSRLALACRLGDLPQARELAGRLSGTFYQQLAERLAADDPPRRRVCLPVKFVRQHHLTCAPATLSALSEYWHQPVEALELAEKICYDGTPAHSERRWAQDNGFHAREFTVTWEAACALLDRAIPFTLTTTEPTSGHLQMVVGYDQLRRCLILRDPYAYNVSEVACPAFLEHYQASGPRGMLMVPRADAQYLADLSLPDAELYDLLYEVFLALERHDRVAACATLERMEERDARHRLTLTAARSLAFYDADSAAQLEAVSRLLELFPDDDGLTLARYGCLTEHAGREERLAFLRGVCQRRGVDPVFFVRLGRELQHDSTQLREAAWWIRRGLRHRPEEAEFLHAYAELAWGRRHLEEAVVLYRFAACLAEQQEYYARSYGSATHLLRRTEEGLAFLRSRFARFGHRAPWPAMTLFDTLTGLQRVEEGFAVLAEAVDRRPEDLDLQLFLADAHARFGRMEPAERHLQAVAGSTRRTSWLRTAATLAAYRSDRAAALSCWREVLATEPLAMDANEAVARLLEETEGFEAARAFVDAACERFPHHVGLLKLRLEVVRSEGAEAATLAVRALLATNPADAWSWRELTVLHLETGRAEEALAAAEQAVRLAPRETYSFSVRGMVHRRLEELSGARADFHQAVTLDVDNGHAIEQLVETAGTAQDKRAALRFVQEELGRQGTFGAGLHAFRAAARALLAPEEVLAHLQQTREAREELWAAWSGVIRQLHDMDRPQQALEVAQEACRRFPFLPTLWVDRARVHQALGQPPEAMAALEQALAISPDFAEAARLLAELQEITGAFDAALKTLEGACARAPLDPVHRGCLADFLWRRKRQDEALEHLQHALRLAPGYSWAWSTLRAWAQVCDRPELAVDLARDLVARRPAEARSWALLAECLAERQDPAAFETMKKAVALNPREADLLDLEARLLARADRFDEALAVCRSLDPAPSLLRIRAAWVEAERGRLKTAIEEMSAVLEDDPDFPAAWQWLSGWYEEAGNPGRAAEAADRLSQLLPQESWPLVRVGALRTKAGDKAGALAAFRRGFELDPRDEAAGITLFDLLIEQEDLPAAAAVLDRLRRHHDSEGLLACEVRLAARQGRAERALRTFTDLCRRPDGVGWTIFQAAEDLEGPDTRSRMLQAVEAHLEAPESHPFLGALWVTQRFEQGRLGVDRRLHRLFEREDSGRITLVQYLNALSERHDRALAAADGWGVREMTSRFLEVFKRHEEQFNADDWLWGKAGYWLLTTSKYQRAVHWLSDWRQRQGVESWMLYNVALSLELTDRWEEAVPVIEEGLGRRQEPQLYRQFAGLGAFEKALAGRVEEAQALVRSVDQEQADATDQAVFALAEVLCLAATAKADPEDLKRRLREMLRDASGADAPAKMHDPARAFYRRALAHLVRQPGLSGLRWWGWWNYRRGGWIWIAFLTVLALAVSLAVPLGSLVLLIVLARRLR